MDDTVPLNATQLCKKIGISTAYLNKMVKQGCPYHQMVEGRRKYYILTEVLEWIYQR